MKNIIIIPVLIAICSACAPLNKAITYRTKDIVTNSDRKLSNLVVDIEQLTDKRKENPTNNILFGKAYEHETEGKRFCINTEQVYNKESVTSQLSSLLVEHMNKRNSFSKVVMNKKDSADYYVTGNLTSFYGEQRLSNVASMGSQFGGVIGALATAWVTTNGKIIIEINDLKIYNKKSGLVKELGSVKKEYVGELPYGPDCTCIYDNINIKLKDYFSELVITLETEIQTVQLEKKCKRGFMQ